MDQDEFDGIIFAGSWEQCNALRYAGRILHVLCQEGNMGFTFRETRYNVAAGDYVILPNAELGSDFIASDDFRGIVMSLAERYVTSIAIRSNYGIIGHLSLLQNPVMKLSERDFGICQTALANLRLRMADHGHLFRHELLGSLLTAHILDLYDIHARSRGAWQVSERVTTLLRQFIELLYNGAYVGNRSLQFYASRLCITPHYLTEICKRVSGMPASFWIDRFTIQEITRLLRQDQLTLTEIAEQMNFSSLSYFSRYVQKNTGLTPSEFKKIL